MADGFAIAAQHRNSNEDDTGFSFVNCTVSGSGTIYLGRAWGNYSRIIYSYSEFDIDVRPGGWEDWRIPSRRKYEICFHLCSMYFQSKQHFCISRNPCNFLTCTYMLAVLWFLGNTSAEEEEQIGAEEQSGPRP